MVEAAQWYSAISIVSSSIALAISAYVVRKIPNRRAGDTFVLAMVFFVLAGSFAYLLRTSTLYYYESNSGPLAYARLFYFFHMLAVGFTASFIGQYFLGFALMRRRVVNLFLQVSLLVVAVGVTLQVNTVGSDYSGIGVVVKDVWATGSLALFATIYMSTALAVLLRTLIRNKDPIVRKQTVLMTAGVVVHGVMAETHAISRIFLALYLPPVLTITALTMAACFAAQPAAVIALEGVEYMANYVGTERLVRCLHTVRDLATSGGGVLLVSADLTSLQEPVTSMLERDFEPLELPVKSGQAVEDVFVIDAAGVLLTHASRAEGADSDPDVIAGALHATNELLRVPFCGGADVLRVF